MRIDFGYRGGKLNPEVVMSDGKSLLRAILIDPDDDTARLVYADWLQENGDADHAEFIRLSVPESTNRGKGKQRAPLARRLRRRWSQELDDYRVALTVRRGFVCGISSPMAVFLENAERAFSLFPLRWWNTECEAVPVLTITGSGWAFAFRSRPDAEFLEPEGVAAFSVGDIPATVAAQMTTLTFDEFGSAASALETAMVAVGRSRAGLPPLRK